MRTLKELWIPYALAPQPGCTPCRCNPCLSCAMPHFNWEFAANGCFRRRALTRSVSIGSTNQLLWATVVPERRASLLDAHAHHAQICCKFLHTRRHNAIRNLLQRYATKTGYTALAEQFALSATTCYDTQLDTQVSSKRGLERADQHLLSPDGVDTYIDFRITTIAYHADVVNHLAEQEKQKRQQYLRTAVKP
eukprot:6428623-Amphidinium_carterae.1